MKRILKVVLVVYTTVFCRASVGAQQATPSVSAAQASTNRVVLVKLAKPVYSPLARQANISGEVRVAVRVGPDGTTETAVESGHPMLKQAAVDSASQSQFECRMCNSPATYTLVYTFKQIEGHDCCSAISTPVTVEQEPQSSDAQGRAQTRVILSAEQVCICDPGPTVRVRSIKCAYLWKCSVR